MVLMKVQGFFNVMLCWVGNAYSHFGWTLCLHCRGQARFWRWSNCASLKCL